MKEMARQQEKERKLGQLRKEQERQAAQKAHEEQLARGAEERAQAEESKRLADQRKEERLQQRLEDERVALQARNAKKAEEAAEKVQRAADQRVAMTKLAREQYNARMVEQNKRMAAQKAARERRVAEIKAAGEMKREVIERTREQQVQLDERRRNQILTAEAQRTQRMEAKAARENEERRLLQHEKHLQEAAARNRVERTMGDLQAQLSALEGQLDARADRLESFTTSKEVGIDEAQRLSIAGALERQALSNSMSKMRSNLTNTGTLYLELPQGRRRVQNRELKALLDRVDPQGEGTIALSSMKRTLTKLLPPMEEAKAKAAAKLTSASLPSLTTLERPGGGGGGGASQYDQYVEAFKAVDTDGSGSISKRELYVVLKKAGLTDTAQALELFQGFDQDADGQLDFEEFTKIARILC